jgi:hypothetical protein
MGAVAVKSGYATAGQARGIDSFVAISDARKIAAEHEGMAQVRFAPERRKAPAKARAFTSEATSKLQRISESWVPPYSIDRRESQLGPLGGLFLPLRLRPVLLALPGRLARVVTTDLSTFERERRRWTRYLSLYGWLAAVPLLRGQYASATPMCPRLPGGPKTKP